MTEATVEERGLRYDRRWMVVDENGMFVTQRIFPRMSLLSVSFDQAGLLISQQHNPENRILLPFERSLDTPVTVTVWKDTVTARTVCDRVDTWLSQQLGKELRIVEMTEESSRKMHPEFAKNDEQLSFADDFPFLLTSEASLESLNSQLDVSVEMSRFRPNFVISGAEPFAEDSWKRIEIGDLAFKVVSSCERCAVINVDPKTGTKSREPLRTLAKYRQIQKKVVFGQNLMFHRQGIIREGEGVQILE